MQMKSNDIGRERRKRNTNKALGTCIDFLLQLSSFISYLKSLATFSIVKAIPLMSSTRLLRVVISSTRAQSESPFCSLHTHSSYGQLLSILHTNVEQWGSNRKTGHAIPPQNRTDSAYFKVNSLYGYVRVIVLLQLILQCK